jgi:hypothetical protein
MRRLSFGFLAAFSILLVAPLSSAADHVAVQATDTGVNVTIDGQPFTTYLFKSGAKPILWPIVGPTGKEMTRAYPMRPGNPDEKTDHIHHRSLFFTHGDVNGIDFWAETAKVQGTTEHRELVKAAGGDVGTIVTRNDWIGPDGKKVLEDERRLKLGGNSEARWIDFDITLKATEGPVTFGDTKEGSFGIRVPGTMKVDAKKGGEIVSSEGLKNGEAWGKSAAWVDYHGPVEGETLGIAVLNHPSSFRYPTYWHVRTYGLFAANPFGLKAFGSGKEGEYVLEKGKSMNLRYLVILHKGDEKEGKIAEAFKTFADENK